jgi:histidinol-phosphatase (PHP family)
MIDYHTHTALCKHAVGTMEEYIEKAIGKGLIEIGVSCHNPMPEGYDLEHRMTTREFDEIYVPGVKKLQEKFGDTITIKFGVEVDFYPGTEAYVRDFIARYGFDYVIGSVHYLGSWPTTELIPVPMFERVAVNARYTEYFERVQQLAESKICDIIAHFDLVKKNGFRPEGDKNGIDKSIDHALLSIKENNLCIEINTSGLRKKVAEVYPAANILRLAGQYGIPLTTGSDAHKPQDVAADFDLAYAMIEKYGNGKVSLFAKRNRTEVAINDLVENRNTSL